MSSAAVFPLGLVALGFVLFGISYAFRSARLKRAIQILAVVAEVGAVMLAVVGISSFMGS